MRIEEIDRLEEETRAFAIEVATLDPLLRSEPELWDTGRQLKRAANSVAANHRAMSRSRSPREFAAKLHTVHEEADEMAHWLGMIQRTAVNRELAELAGRQLIQAARIRNMFGRARATTRRRFFPTE